MTYLQSALSGLDIALWDVKGKKLGVPIWQLLGGKVRDRIKVYGWIGGDSPQAVLEGAAKRKEQGFTAVKMNGTSKPSTCPERGICSQFHRCGRLDRLTKCFGGYSFASAGSEVSRFGRWSRLSWSFAQGHG